MKQQNILVDRSNGSASAYSTGSVSLLSMWTLVYFGYTALNV